MLHDSIYITSLNDRIIEMGTKSAVVKVKDGRGGHREGSGCDYKDVAWGDVSGDGIVLCLDGGAGDAPYTCRQGRAS